ncbi:ABC transporter substrate-binding protein [Paenibacillus hodogayensis]|uniref:ABC transporter substrate-binding protein n=1 Tax=Paenibacillus hodogayensis TaxID=279208 RepID=A0ABV5W355_9BACL
MRSGERKRRSAAAWLLSLLLVALAVLGSACGAGEQGAPLSMGSEGASQAGSTSEQPKGEAKPKTRKVQTEKGEVEIPTEPKRIVALYYHHMLLALDEKPVGANLAWWGGSPFLKQQESGIKDVGGPPSLEVVVGLQPDLIIMNSNNANDYEQFSKIAPSVLIPYDANRSAYDDAKLVAELIGKPQVADQLAARFEQKASAARKSLADTIGGGKKAAIVRADGKGDSFSVFGDNYGRGGWPIYRGLKFVVTDKMKEAITSGKQIVQKLSLEQLSDYVGDADYLFLSDEGEGTEQLKASSVWKSLPAVKNGKVIELSKAQFFYFDPISIEGQLDVITQLLSKPK